jgi:hypothetical protein
MMETLLAILSAALGASGVFASSGAIQIITKLFKSIISSQGAEIGLKNQVRVRTTDSVEDEAILDRIKRERHPPLVEVSYRNPGLGLFYAFILVVFVFATAIGVVWTLTHIGGALEATVNATIEKAGGSILIVGGGLFAAFFAVSFMAFVAIRVFSGRIDR